MKKKTITIKYRRCLREGVIIIYLYSLSAKITMNFQKEQFELKVISVTYSNQTISEMFKISIKIKLPWICH